MLFRRMGQFFIVYALGIGLLSGIKFFFSLSDYVIPGPALMAESIRAWTLPFFRDVLNTLGVTILGQVLSIVMAFAVGIAGRKSSWAGTFIRVAAYNIQAYPIVALAPIIFILIGDGFLARLIIAAMICYFPLLLSVLGIMSAPVTHVEHFYRQTGRMRWQLEVKIRAFENLSKLVTVISGSTTLAMAGTIVAEFIAANAGIGYSIRIALYQSDLAKILVALFTIGVCVSIYQGLLESLAGRIHRQWLSDSR